MFPETPLAFPLHNMAGNQKKLTHEHTAILRLGTSGLVLPVPNKKAFPPAFRAGSRLAYYSSLFNSIEINSSFYKVPMPVTFARWANEVPLDFRFTVKLWQGITHVKGLRFKPADVNRFLFAADQLGSKKGCLLIQLPPGLQAGGAGQLDRLLEQVCLADPQRSWKVAIEFRHRSWYNPELDALFDRYRATRVLHDMPGSMVSEPLGHGNLVYIRWHGPAGDYRGGYHEPALELWAQKIRDWQLAKKEVYAYFNNTIGDAIVNLNTLRAHLSAIANSSTIAGGG
jgi:uncharacterized protein YecE (DUF72 family)